MIRFFFFFTHDFFLYFKYSFFFRSFISRSFLKKKQSVKVMKGKWTLVMITWDGKYFLSNYTCSKFLVSHGSRVHRRHHRTLHQSLLDTMNAVRQSSLCRLALRTHHHPLWCYHNLRRFLVFCGTDTDRSSYLYICKSSSALPLCSNISKAGNQVWCFRSCFSMNKKGGKDEIPVREHSHVAISSFDTLLTVGSLYWTVSSVSCISLWSFWVSAFFWNKW